MIELAIAVVAALYTARLAVREAERAVSPRPSRAAAPAAPSAPTAPVTERARPVVEAAPAEAGRPAEPVGVALLRPDPEHLIQTEVVVDHDERPVAFAKLAIGIAALGAVFAFAALGVVRGIGVLLRKLSGG